MPKKFLVEFSETDPFDINESNFKDPDVHGWDRIFERESYEVKKETLEQFQKDIEVFVDNRKIAQSIFQVSSADLTVINDKVDILLMAFLQGLYFRMIKSSKVIQDLSIHGNYIEAKTILRTNLERSILIIYFIDKKKELEEFLEARKKFNHRVLKKYSIKRLAEKVNIDYSKYSYLCHFSHPFIHSEDILLDSMNGSDFIMLTAYNEFDPKEFMWINGESNNLIIETLGCIVNYLSKFVPKGEEKNY